MERYEHVFRLQNNLYTKNSPVLIVAGALVKDNQTNGILAQMKFQNLCRKKIIAVKVKLDSYDISGKELTGNIEYQYLDLSASQYEFFGENIGVPLPDSVSRSFAVKCTSVYFEDASVWNENPGAFWTTIPKQEKLVDILDADLKSEIMHGYRNGYLILDEFKPMQYEDVWLCSCGKIHKKTEEKCYFCFLPQSSSDEKSYQHTIEKIKSNLALQKARKEIVVPNKFLQQSSCQSLIHPIKFYYSENENCWSCVCGEVNSNEQDECLRCKRKREVIKKEFNQETLNKNVAEFERKEAERIAAEKEKIKNAAKNLGSTAKNIGNTAKDISNSAKNLSKATKKKLIIIPSCVLGCASLITIILLIIFLFVPLGIEKANEEKFELAVSYMEEDRHEEAIEIFEELNGFKNSERKIQLCYYSLGLKAMESEDYDSAIKYFEASGPDFKEKLIEAKRKKEGIY